MRSFEPAKLWAASDGGCVWKIDASDLIATRDPEYPEIPDFLVLINGVPVERLVGLYDCTSETWLAPR